MKWLDRALVISPYYYGLCQSEKVFEKELRRLKIPKPDWPDFIIPTANATVHFFTHNDDNKSCAIVCLGDVTGRTANEVVGLLIHEAVHIWQAIRESIGERHPSAEFEAYSIQCIAQRLIEAYVAPEEKPGDQ
ncbi:MAG: hypothetical protein ACXWT0_01690 [Methylobacter sp.]